MQHQYSNEDLAFKASVEDCSIAVKTFDHRAHLRLAYIYLVDYDADEATIRVRATLTALLRHNNIEPSAKYHETLTKAWLLAVRHFMDEASACDSAGSFIDRHPAMLDSGIMLTHYSKDRLFSDEAREKFLEPDLAPTPAR